MDRGKLKNIEEYLQKQSESITAFLRDIYLVSSSVEIKVKIKGNKRIVKKTAVGECLGD